MKIVANPIVCAAPNADNACWCMPNETSEGEGKIGTATATGSDGSGTHRPIGRTFIGGCRRAGWLEAGRESGQPRWG